MCNMWWCDVVCNMECDAIRNMWYTISTSNVVLCWMVRDVVHMEWCMMWNTAWCEIPSVQSGMCSEMWNVLPPCGGMWQCDVELCSCGVQYVVVWCGCGCALHSTSHYHVLVSHFTPCFVTSLHHIAHSSHILLHCSHITCRIMCTMWCTMRCGVMSCRFVIWNGAWCGVVRCGMRYVTVLPYHALPHHTITTA